MFKLTSTFEILVLDDVFCKRYVVTMIKRPEIGFMPASFAYDNNGNVTKYIDENGNIVAAYEYDDFGRIISQTGPMADFFRIRFSTKYFDPETGLYYYYGYRFYSSTLMRWLNRDPIEEEGGMNLYGFCGNNAAARIDYLGMVSIDESLLNMYDLTSDAAKGPMLAYTKATAGVIVACKCMKNEWSLSDVKVNILTQVHLRKQGYGRIGLELFVLKSEKEHVDDIRSGIRNLIFPTLVNLELILKMNKHQSNIECIESNKTAFLQQVRILIRQIEVDSASRHDKTGKHTFIW